jgi:hypothetical protein
MNMTGNNIYGQIGHLIWRAINNTSLYYVGSTELTALYSSAQNSLWTTIEYLLEEEIEEYGW